MPHRILIADDSAVVRVALVRRLRSAGLDVVEAASVAEATAIDPRTVDLAILDFDLGDGFGDTIAAHLHAARPALPLAFFTSSSPAETEARLGPHGPTFAKPGDADAVIAWALETAQSMV